MTRRRDLENSVGNDSAHQDPAEQDPLADEPFTYAMSKSGLLRLSYRGRVVTTLRDRAAAKLHHRLEHSDRSTCQQLLARATGQFKFGNEGAARTTRANRRAPE